MNLIAILDATVGVFGDGVEANVAIFRIANIKDTIEGDFVPEYMSKFTI